MNLRFPPSEVEPSPQPLNTGASKAAPVPETICGVSVNSAIKNALCPGYKQPLGFVSAANHLLLGAPYCPPEYDQDFKLDAELVTRTWNVVPLSGCT